MENKKAGVMACMRGVLRFMKPYRGKAVLAVLMVVVSQLTFALNPSVEGLITSQLSDDAVDIINGVSGAHVHFDIILRIMLVLLGLYLLKTVSQLITAFCLTDAIQGTMHDLRNALQQKIQHDASQIDNYLEQRVVILQNAAKLLDKAIDLDKDTMTKVAAYRANAGHPGNDAERNATNANIDKLFGQVNVAFEQYPDLKAHEEIAQCLQQNSYLQKEITAARELYNDTVYKWNADIQAWPTKMIVAAKAGYTTRIPFSTSAEIKEKARGTFF